MTLPRDYYTIEQAAIKLTEIFAENVSVDDVRRYIEAEHIIPAFRLNRVQATPGTTLYNFSPGKMKYENVRVQSADCQIPLEGMFSPLNLKFFFDNGWQVDICRKGFVIPALYEIYDEKFSSYIPTETPTYLVVEPCIISASDMLITKRELVRFESEHGKTDTTDMEPAAPTPALNPVEVYLEQHSNSPLKEKVRWLRENARISNADIGDLLNIGTADPKSRGSRKQKVQDFYRANFDDETWQKMHPEKKYKK